MRFNRHHQRPGILRAVHWNQKLRYLTRGELDAWCAAVTAAQDGRTRLQRKPPLAELDQFDLMMRK